jgi:hypothetical protein
VAIGLLGIGMALWTSAFPSLVERVIEPLGWRTTYVLLGAMVALTILPLGALVFRDRPERFGLLPDGAAPSTAAEVRPRRPTARGGAGDAHLLALPDGPVPGVVLRHRAGVPPLRDPGAGGTGPRPWRRPPSCRSA